MNPVVEFSKKLKAARQENLKHVQDQALTIEEAAKCLAGAVIKAREELGNAIQVDHEAEYRTALHWLESQLPDYQGIRIGRHI